MAMDLTKGTWLQELLEGEQMCVVFSPEDIEEPETHGIAFGSQDFMIYRYLKFHGKSDLTNRTADDIIEECVHLKAYYGIDTLKSVKDSIARLEKAGLVKGGING